MTVLSLSQVTFGYDRDHPVLDGLSLDVKPGERVVIAGASGCGKSTLLKLAAGLLEPREGQVVSRAGEAGVGFVRQQPENQIVAASVAEEVAFALEYRMMDPAAIRTRVDEALEHVGLAAFADRGPHHLSGGQMQRLAFAAAWAMRPRLWLLDEPTAYLDHDGRGRLHRLLEALPADVSVLLVASSPEEYTLFDRLLVLGGGDVVADGTPEEVFASDVLAREGLQPPRDWRLRRGGPGGDAGVHPPEKGLPEVPEAGSAGVHSPAKPVSRVVMRDARVSRRRLFREQTQVLEDVNLELRGGEVAALVGLSGAGKSTLLESLAGLLEVQAGDVRWDGEPPEALRGRIGVAFQFPERSFFAETVLGEVAYGPRNMGLERDEARERARRALRAFGLDPDELGQRSPFELSGGQARRVALAAVWALRPAGYLLDEPTAGLGAEDADLVGRMFRAEADRGCPVLITGHDLDRFADWADRWLLLSQGRIAADGRGAEWWTGDPSGDPWPAPATVRAWRRAGRSVADMPSTAWGEVRRALAGRA